MMMIPMKLSQAVSVTPRPSFHFSCHYKEAVWDVKQRV